MKQRTKFKNNLDGAFIFYVTLLVLLCLLVLAVRGLLQFLWALLIRLHFCIFPKLTKSLLYATLLWERWECRVSGVPHGSRYPQTWISVTFISTKDYVTRLSLQLFLFQIVFKPHVLPSHYVKRTHMRLSWGYFTTL